MSQQVTEPSYEVARKGTPLGSYRLIEIASEIASGKLVWTDDCWTEGMESWAKLADIKDQVESAGSPVSRPTGRTRLPLYAGITVLGLLVAGLSAFFLSAPASTEVASEVTTAPAASTSSPSGIARDKPVQLGLSEVQDKISMLVASSFQTNKDGDGTVTFTHRFYKQAGNRIPLRVTITADGRCAFESFYQGKEWIFHRQLRFVIGKQTLETSVLEAHRRGRAIGEDNSVTESCRFGSPDDAKLVALLAAASDFGIMFHMVARKPTATPLSYETKAAIKESHELALLLARRRKLLEDLGISP
jgi:hypothetical protein